MKISNVFMYTPLYHSKYNTRVYTYAAGCSLGLYLLFDLLSIVHRGCLWCNISGCVDIMQLFTMTFKMLYTEQIMEVA